MLTFLFWNTNSKDLLEPVVHLATEYEPDLLILIEPALSQVTLLETLNNRSGPLYYLTTSLCEDISILSRFPEQFITPIYESGRITIRKLLLPATDEILLVAVHLPSRLYVSKESQPAEFFELSRTIREVEHQVGHTRTILLGDLNANPFDVALVSSAGLNATMSKQIAARRKRIVQSRKYPFFYNPMWSLLGDNSPGPPGTYFYRQSEDVCYYWHMIDQVLLRPELMEKLAEDTPNIITTAGDLNLTSKNCPNKKKFSDHLPILFRLKI